MPAKNRGISTGVWYMMMEHNVLTSMLKFMIICVMVMGSFTDAMYTKIRDIDHKKSAKNIIM